MRNGHDACVASHVDKRSRGAAMRRGEESFCEESLRTSNARRLRVLLERPCERSKLTRHKAQASRVGG